MKIMALFHFEEWKMYYPDFETFSKFARNGGNEMSGNLVPVSREILADTETPVSALIKFSSHPYMFLLESVEGGEKWGRYTFIGTDPRAVFRVPAAGSEVVITENGGTRKVPHNGDPLGVLRQELQRFRLAPVDGLPRFCGGAVGFMGHDMARYFEPRSLRGEGAPSDDIGADTACFLITDTLLIFDNVKHTIKVISCAAVDEGRDPREVYDQAAAKIDAAIATLRCPPKRENGAVRFNPDFRLVPNMEEQAFKSMVEKGKQYIAAGDIIQVVLSQRFEVDRDGLDPVNIYRALRFVNPSPYLFFLKMEDTYLVGSSPEVMVRLEDGVAELRPIAGTRRRGRTEQEDRKLADELLKDPKEKAEHVMLVDLGRNDLGRIARTGSVQVNQLMAVERYSHVMHLVSNIQAQLASGRDAFDVLRASFPAGTLSGAPKIRAMQIIDELEPARRGPYGGGVGYFSFSGNMDFCITIRTFVIRNGKIYVQAGAGIVADSDPNAEYKETLSKAQGLVEALRMAAAGFEVKTA
jgi:anthranilate synthase component 1